MNLMQLRGWVRQTVANASARMTTIAKSDPVGQVELTGRQRGLDGEEGDDEEEGQDPAQVYQQYGLRSRPGAGAVVVTLPCGAASSQRVVIASEVAGTGPVDLKDYEVELYARHGQRIRLRQDEGLYLTVDSGAGLSLKPNGEAQIFAGTSGSVASLINDRLTVTNEIAAQRLYFGGSPPVAVTTNPNVTTAAVSGGNDSIFKLAVVVGPNPAVGTVCTVTYAVGFGSAPIVSVAQKGSNEKLNWSETASAITITATALPVGSYEFIITSMGTF